jgi:hypothetical protein
VANKEKKGLKNLPQKAAFEIKIAATYEQPFPTFYSNYAVVSHTTSELSIDFCLLATPHKIDVETKTASVPVIARMLIPGAMANGLMTALQDQIKKFEITQKTNTLAVGRKK